MTDEGPGMGAIVFQLEALSRHLTGGGFHEEEWLRVYRHFDPRMRSFFSDRVQDDVELDALVAEVWRRLLLHVGELKAAEVLWAWMTTVGGNVLRDWGRARQRRRRHEVVMSEALADAELVKFISGWGQEPRLNLGEGGSATLLEHLAPEEREFLELFAVDGLGHEELAQRFGLASAMASRKRLSRLRKRLADYSEDKSEGMP